MIWNRKKCGKSSTSKAKLPPSSADYKPLSSVPPEIALCIHNPVCQSDLDKRNVSVSCRNEGVMHLKSAEDKRETNESTMSQPRRKWSQKFFGGRRKKSRSKVKGAHNTTLNSIAEETSKAPSEISEEFFPRVCLNRAERYQSQTSITDIDKVEANVLQVERAEKTVIVDKIKVKAEGVEVEETEEAQEAGENQLVEENQMSDEVQKSDEGHECDKREKADEEQKADVRQKAGRPQRADEMQKVEKNERAEGNQEAEDLEDVQEVQHIIRVEVAQDCQIARDQTTVRKDEEQSKKEQIDLDPFNDDVKEITVLDFLATIEMQEKKAKAARRPFNSTRAAFTSSAKFCMTGCYDLFPFSDMMDITKEVTREVAAVCSPSNNTCKQAWPTCDPPKISEWSWEDLDFTKHIDTSSIRNIPQPNFSFFPKKFMELTESTSRGIETAILKSPMVPTVNKAYDCNASRGGGSTISDLTLETENKTKLDKPSEEKKSYWSQLWPVREDRVYLSPQTKKLPTNPRQNSKAGVKDLVVNEVSTRSESTFGTMSSDEFRDQDDSYSSRGSSLSGSSAETRNNPPEDSEVDSSGHLSRISEGISSSSTRSDHMVRMSAPNHWDAGWKNFKNRKEIQNSDAETVDTTKYSSGEGSSPSSSNHSSNHNGVDTSGRYGAANSSRSQNASDDQSSEVSQVYNGIVAHLFRDVKPMRFDSMSCNTKKGSGGESVGTFGSKSNASELGRLIATQTLEADEDVFEEEINYILDSRVARCSYESMSQADFFPGDKYMAE